MACRMGEGFVSLSIDGETTILNIRRLLPEFLHKLLHRHELSAGTLVVSEGYLVGVDR